MLTWRDGGPTKWWEWPIRFVSFLNRKLDEDISRDRLRVEAHFAETGEDESW